jgi:molybdopterin molybdotransferase
MRDIKSPERRNDPEQRMDLLPVETALERVLAGVEPLSEEKVALTEAGGRVLAEPVIARRRQPAFNASAMDGYAFSSADAQPGGRLSLIGEAAAGRRFRGSLGPNQAVRIFTGAPLPDGADAVLAQEDAVVDGPHLVIRGAVEPLSHVRLAGADFDIGDELLPAGRVVGPRELAAVAAANLEAVSVRRKPRVAVLSIGDELVAPGTEPGPDQTIATNAYAIVGMARAAGAATEDLGIVDDETDRVAEIAKRVSSDADVLVTIGGASVGDHDVARPGLAAAGMELDFWRIAMRPGKPLVFGRLGAMAVLGLPGNPVSSFVCGMVFLRPLIGALLGRPRDDGVTPAVLGADMPANGVRTTYLRAKLTEREDRLPEAVPLRQQDSSLLGVLAQADCLLIRPANAEPSVAGSICSIIRL